MNENMLPCPELVMGMMMVEEGTPYTVRSTRYETSWRTFQLGNLRLEWCSRGHPWTIVAPYHKEISRLGELDHAIGAELAKL